MTNAVTVFSLDLTGYTQCILSFYVIDFTAYYGN